jgi:site-specific DNA-cytosine methylase
MKVLIACEFSGIVREAFAAKGHDAYSADLLPSEIPSKKHIEGDIMGYLFYICPTMVEPFDLMIAHPPCDHLAVSGARWFKEKQEDGRQEAAKLFFMRLVHAPIKRIAIENPIGIMSSFYRKPDQIIQPWQYGHGETKATCLWLKGLPKLQPTNIVHGREARIHKEPPSPERWKNRSRTLKGIAEAMADQWGNYIDGGVTVGIPPLTKVRGILPTVL